MLQPLGMRKRLTQLTQMTCKIMDRLSNYVVWKLKLMYQIMLTTPKNIQLLTYGKSFHLPGINITCEHQMKTDIVNMKDEMLIEKTGKSNKKFKTKNK